MTINQIDIKKLFSLSAGQCNICKQSVIDENVVIGEMAHIIARSPRGPRGTEDAPKNDTYENLILLCSNDHKKVDSLPTYYSEGKLHEIKSNHEANIRDRLNITREHEDDLNSLNAIFKFMPFLKLRGMAMDLPSKISLDFFISEVFLNFRKDNPHLYPFWDEGLTQLWEEFISSASAIEDFTSSNICGDKIYPLGHFETNHACYNIYIGDESGHFANINKKFLSENQIGLIEDLANQLVQSFVCSHTKLIDYVRNQFKEIKWRSSTD